MGASEAAPERHASLASARRERVQYRQPGSFRPGKAICGDARTTGLKAGVAGSARCAR